MPNYWKKYKLGDLCNDISYGYTESAAWDKIGPKFLRITDIQNDFINWETVPYCKISEKDRLKYQLYFGDIVIARTGNSTGATAIIKDSIEAVYASYLIRYSLKRELAYPFFIGHILKSQIWKGFVQSIISGSAQPGANAKQFAEFEITLPPLPEQQAIAEILSALDDKIELNLQTNKTLEEMANALYKHWFVDFGPFKNGKFIESELGMIPENFKVLSIGEVSANNAKTFNFNGKEKVIFINTGDVLQGEFLHTNYSNVADLPGQAKKAIELNDILFTEIRPGNKRYALINFDSSEFVVSTKFMVIKSNEKILPRILYRILRNEKVIGEFQKIAESRSGTFPQITFDAIKHLNFVIGDLTIQNTFMEKVLPMELLIDSNNEEIKKIKQTRDYLLPKLITGQIRVKDAEKMAKEVLCRS